MSHHGSIEKKGSEPDPEHFESPKSDYVIDPALERTTMRKVDWRLVPILGALYSFALIDRANLGLVYVGGMGLELKLAEGPAYSTVVLMFFVPYIVLEIPANIAVRHVGAKVWLGTIALLWGAVMTGMAFVPNWQTLAGLRGLLGALEAGFFPACAYLISCWYKRSEMQLRLACFYLVSTLAGGFSSILAYGLGRLHGKDGRSGWRWVFLVEGIITMGLAVIAYFLIVDFPDKNTFLTPEQTKLVRERINADRGDAEYDHLTGKKFLSHALDWKVWVYGLMFFANTVPAYALASFMPIIFAGAGYSVSQSQLLSAPPYVVAVAFALGTSFACDRTGKRGAYLIFHSCICIMGLMLVAYGKDRQVRYAGAFFGLMGCQANIPTVLAYQSTNIVGQSKRGVSNAIVVAWGGIGGIYSGLTFRSQDRIHGYIPGLWSTFAVQAMCITLTLIMTAYFVTINKRVKAGTHAPIADRPGFFYTP